MKLSLSFLIVPLLASPWAAALEARSGCKADNCLRALRNPTRTAAATSFCRTYTQANVTATTALPTQFATPCGSGLTQSERLSSACSCYVPPPGCSDTDTSSDSNNCGACGNVCVPGSTCSAGACVCTNSGQAPCNGQCPDLTSDNGNCGACGNTCALGTTCVSGTCAPLPEPCSSYTASCSSVMGSLLGSNSIASPQLVDYRIQSAILGITSPSDFLAALGPDPCQIFTDPTEYSSCVDLLENSQFVAQLTDITTGFLGEFQSCASDFAMGAPDYEIIIDAPSNGTCTGQNGPRRNGKRTFDVGEDNDLTRRMLDEVEYYRRTAGVSSLGKPKSSDLQLVRKQLNTCSQTGVCFERCPDCRNQQTYCGTQATIITTAVCGSLAALANAAVATIAGTACAAACGPAAPICAGICARAAGGLSAVAIGAACAQLRSAICDPLTERCANCNSANNGICNPGSTQCCAGETGTQCGANCCCCPRCQAPGGVNCECTAAPC